MSLTLLWGAKEEGKLSGRPSLKEEKVGMHSIEQRRFMKRGGVGMGVRWGKPTLLCIVEGRRKRIGCFSDSAI